MQGLHADTFKTVKRRTHYLQIALIKQLEKYHDQKRPLVTLTQTRPELEYNNAKYHINKCIFLTSTHSSACVTLEILMC